ncbi:tRNA-dihydrouridine synthase [Candidatus Saccharibacteria bacterium]|nr:tRNA-dihydrouridine synthase [Candidatus Saccharibacteria bacterium]
MNFWDKLPHPFTVLAPMEGVTDIVFRRVIETAGRPNVFFTEFTNVSSYASEKGRQNALERLDIFENEHPIVAQIWGKEPEHFKKTATALEGLGFDGLDINMGCPDKHVNKAGGGAAMINTPELAIDCIKSAKENTSLPVSVKTRLGYSKISEYENWLTLLLQQDLAALTVHLRTKKEMSKVPAHFELIDSIIALRDKIAPQTKLIINGDIENLEQITDLHATHPSVDGFMIGRGVFKNPFCFKPQNSKLAPLGQTSHIPSQKELLRLLALHLNLFDARRAELENRGSKYSYEPLKHFYKIYVNNFDGAKELRIKLMDCKTTDEARKIITPLIK